MTALRFAFRSLALIVLLAMLVLLGLVVLMRLGFAPAGEILFGLAYCLDGYGFCGSKT